jgi:hypothetical protein
MKLTKLSLVAALLIGSSAFAIENTKVSGDAKLYYGTFNESGSDVDMFDKDASYGDAAIHLGLTTDLTEGVSGGVSVTAVSTLGLENNLVSQTWSNSHEVSNSEGASFYDGLQVDDSMWIDEAWIAGTALDTTLKVGRQTLDTPLVFTENWGVDTNTFEAAVLINQSIPDTTIVAAYVGKSNGAADDEATGITLNGAEAAQAGYVAQDGKFNTFAKDGAYAAGVINNSWKPLTAQAWYYDMQKLAQAYWLQADLNLEGFLAGAQYANTDVDDGESLDGYLGNPRGTTLSTNDTSMYSVMVGYEMKDIVTVKAAYSSVDDDGTLGMANTATGAAATVGGQSKMYTEMWWNYGAVSAVGADSYSVTAEATVGPEIDLFLGYYFADIDPTDATNAPANFSSEEEITEVAFTVSKSFGPLDTSLAVIWDDIDDQSAASTNDDDYSTTNLQVYLTYNF